MRFFAALFRAGASCEAGGLRYQVRLAVKARGSEVQKTMAKYTKRRDKRGYEWKSAYREKEALMLERGYPEVSPHDFYRELFPAGSLQQEPEDGKGNIIATQIRPSGKGRTRQWVIDDSLKMLDKVIGDRFYGVWSICAHPITGVNPYSRRYCLHSLRKTATRKIF